MRAAFARRPLACAALLFAVGTWAGLRLGIAPLCWGALSAFGAVTLTIYALRGNRATGALLALTLALGGWLAALSVEPPALPPEHTARIEATVALEPVYGAERASIRLQDLTIDGIPLRGPAQLYSHHYAGAPPPLELGQRIEVTGRVYRPAPRTNPQGFDFRDFLARHGTFLCVSAGADAVTPQPPGAPWLRTHFLRARKSLEARIDTLSPHYAALTKALLLGMRDDLEAVLVGDFQRSGLAHILALSGLHVSLLAFALDWLLRRAGLRAGARFALLGALLAAYAMLTGLSPSVVRAAIMYAAFAGARVIGRRADSLTSLSVAFFALALWRPGEMLDVGFALSFCSVAGLMLLPPTLEAAYAALRNRVRGEKRTARPSRARRAVHWVGRYARGLIFATAGAQLATLPLIALWFHKLPLVSFLTNPAGVPCAALSILASMAALALDFLWHDAARLVMSIAELGYAALTGVTALGARVASTWLPALPVWLMPLYFALVYRASPYARGRTRRRCLILLGMPALACALLLQRTLLPAPGLTYVQLDVGQGDGAALTVNGRLYLADVGLDDGRVADYALAHAPQVEAVFLSHLHDDHAGGLAALLALCPPRAVYLPRGWRQVNNDGFSAQSIETARDMGIAIRELGRGDIIDLGGGASARVLAPDQPVSDANLNALVIEFRYAGRSVLTFGDAGRRAAVPDLPRALLLKVPHHGAADSLYEAMFARGGPDAAVISVGRNSYGHPTRAALNRLAQSPAVLLRTDRMGAVTLRISPEGDATLDAFLPGEVEQ